MDVQKGRWLKSTATDPSTSWLLTDSLKNKAVTNSPMHCYLQWILPTANAWSETLKHPTMSQLPLAPKSSMSAPMVTIPYSLAIRNSSIHLIRIILSQTLVEWWISNGFLANGYHAGGAAVLPWWVVADHRLASSFWASPSSAPSSAQRGCVKASELTALCNWRTWRSWTMTELRVDGNDMKWFDWVGSEWWIIACLWLIIGGTSNNIGDIPSIYQAYGFRWSRASPTNGWTSD